MPWFKVDDTLPLNSKVVAAGNAAMGLWVRAGAYCAQQLTDGFIADHMIPVLGKPIEAKRLVAVGLWSRVSGGYLFHQWDERQPSAEQVVAERSAARERQRRARERAKSQRDSTRVSRRDARSDTTVSHGPPDPTRPVPTTADAVVESADAQPSAVITEIKPKGKRATTIPDSFTFADVAEWTATAGLPVDASDFEHFRDYHTAKGSTMKDWHAAWRTWAHNARRFGGKQKLSRDENVVAWANLTTPEQKAIEG